MLKNTIIIAIIPIFLISCEARNSSISNEAAGTGIGALAGGLLGNKLSGKKNRKTATIVGALIGGIVGNSIGRQLDNSERIAAGRTEFYALESGRSGSKYNWDNPDTGNNGYVVPGKAYDRSGSICRPYTHNVYIDGKARVLKGRACRNPDGSWSAL